MSTYCHLVCKTCQESLFVKDSDSDVHAEPHEHGMFLEKHYGHHLVFLWEDDLIQMDGKEKSPSDEWERFKKPTNGWWSHGHFFGEPQ